MSELSLILRDGKDYVEWTPEIAEQWRIGKAACEAKDWTGERERIIAGLETCNWEKCSVRGFLTNALCAAYAAGLAAGQKAEHDAMLLNVPKVRRKLNLGNTGEPQ